MERMERISFGFDNHSSYTIYRTVFTNDVNTFVFMLFILFSDILIDEKRGPKSQISMRPISLTAITGGSRP